MIYQTSLINQASHSSPNPIKGFEILQEMKA